MNTTPKVSVIMPSLNVGPYIRECIDSVVNQTLRDIEIICVDAGSTDGTLEVLEEYAAKDSRITIIHSDKKSYGYQMNLGIDAATGEYIGIVETDDYILPNMFEDLYEIARRESADICKGDFMRFWGEGEDRTFEYVKVPKENLYDQVLNATDNPNILKCNNLNQPGIYSLRLLRDKSIRLNETPGASYQDNGFWFQVTTQAERVYYVNKAYYILRRDNPNSSVKSKGKVYCMCDEYDYIREVLRGKPELEKRFASYLAYYRMNNYYFTLNRIAPEFKREFLLRFSKDFKMIEADGELDPELYSQEQWKKLKRIMRCPRLFWFLKYHRLGLLAVKVMKKLRKGFRCLREHGFFYTCKRVLVHLHLIQDDKKKDYAYYSSLAPSKYPKELKSWYKRVTGDDLDLNDPKSFNEKIQWMKLYDATPLKTRLADKYLVRDWVKEKIGEEYLIPLLGVWDSFDEIDFENLPNRFALKANHGSGWNVIVNDKSQLDMKSAKEKFDKWISTNFAFCYGLELQYMNIPPKIIAEKYIENPEGLKDYRFYCFNGKPVQVWVDIFSGTPNHLRSVFDMDWNPVPLKCKWPEGGDLLSPKPKSFEKMKEFATLLSQGFAFVRVDFFEVDGKLYMGEMTFTPMTGVGKFSPQEWDKQLGDLLVLPPKSPIPTRQFQ